MTFGKVAGSRSLKVKELIDIGNVVTLHPSIRGRAAISGAKDTLIASAGIGPVMNLFVVPYFFQLFGGVMGNIYGGKIDGKGGGGMQANWVAGAKLLILYAELGIPMSGKTETSPGLSIGIGGGF
jgi:hypothetical protein